MLVGITVGADVGMLVGFEVGLVDGELVVITVDTDVGM